MFRKSTWITSSGFIHIRKLITTAVYAPQLLSQYSVYMIAWILWYLSSYLSTSMIALLFLWLHRMHGSDGLHKVCEHRCIVEGPQPCPVSKFVGFPFIFRFHPFLFRLARDVFSVYRFCLPEPWCTSQVMRERYLCIVRQSLLPTRLYILCTIL